MLRREGLIQIFDPNQYTKYKLYFSASINVELNIILCNIHWPEDPTDNIGMLLVPVKRPFNIFQTDIIQGHVSLGVPFTTAHA